MVNDHLEIFIDRLEAIELFKLLQERKTHQNLPILNIIGPFGSGKTTLITYLRNNYCRPSKLPYARLDFAGADTPKDLLGILGKLRDKFQERKDEQGRRLPFPRFDIAFTLLNKQAGKETDVVDAILLEIGNAIGNLFPLAGPAILLIRLLARIPPLRVQLRKMLLQQLGKRPEWNWYRTMLNVPDRVGIEEVIERLNEMSASDEPERDMLIEHILPEALLADIRYALYESKPAKAWNDEAIVVIFLDNLDKLLHEAEETGKRLLEALALHEHRRRGKADGLLLIVSSQRELPHILLDQQDIFFAPEVALSEEKARKQAVKRYEKWQQKLPAPGGRKKLELKDLYLPLPLRNFGIEGTRSLLLQLDQWYNRHLFTSNALIEEMYRETKGHPLFLSRLAEAVQTANTQNQRIDIQTFFASETGELIVERLLTHFCHPAEMQDLIFCSVPRTLDAELLCIILELHKDTELKEKWRYFRHLPFVRVTGDKKRLAFHPGVRSLLLKKLPAPTGNAESDYLRMHQRLMDYFDTRVKQSLVKGQMDEAARIEWAYHTLALGDPQPVIELAINEQKNNPTLWKSLLEVIEHAPTQRMPPDIEQRAMVALEQAKQQNSKKDAVTAIVLYMWLLASPGSDKKRVASLWYQLGDAYRSLLKESKQTTFDAAQTCYKRALSITAKPIDTESVPAVPPPAIIPATSWNARILGRQIWLLMQGTYQGIKKSKRAQALLAITLISAMVGTLVVSLFIVPRVPPPPPDPFNLPLIVPSQQTKWIGVTVEPNKEYIGLSDGSVPFDFLRPDGPQKIQAAQMLQKRDFAGAVAKLQEAAGYDTNDAETLISEYNARIWYSGKRCTTFIVATTIVEDAGEGVNVGRDNLQGAYIAQKEYNDLNPDKVCLYIANMGSDPANAPAVASQIVKAAKADKSIKGVIGWPAIASAPYSMEAAHILSAASIPIVSPGNYDELQFAPNIFHVAPSDQEQGRTAARYAEGQLQTTRAALFVDPFDIYSRSLAQGFKASFEQDGKTIVAPESYTAGHTDAGAFEQMLHDALRAKPDVIYFAGNADDGRMLLAQVTYYAPSMHVLGGDALYQFLGYSPNARPDFKNLAFTTFASPDTATAKGMQQLYQQSFDPNDPGHIHSYGYSRPDSDAILSYDAMEVLMKGFREAANGADVQHILLNVQIQGASRPVIAFTSLNELSDQHVIVLYVDQKHHLQTV